MSNAMTGPLLTRAEQRAFVLALMDVPVGLWWWSVINRMPAPVRRLLRAHEDGGTDEPRECLAAAADLLRPRYSRDDVEAALVQLAVMNARNDWGAAAKTEQDIIRMITGEEP